MTRAGSVEAIREAQSGQTVDSQSSPGTCSHEHVQRLSLGLIFRSSLRGICCQRTCCLLTLRIRKQSLCLPGGSAREGLNQT